MSFKMEKAPAKGSRMLRRACARFAKEEEGSLTIFSLYIFILMIALGGLATDIMHYDTVQTKLQNTSDRASLAGADLDQTLDSEAVVRDYFAKSDMTKFLKNVKVTGGINWRQVEVDTEATIPTYFMFWSSDTKQLVAAADSTATERVTDIEISLVLDVSGSMGGTKLTRLQSAAGTFFDSVIKNTTDPTLGLTSVSVVPYNHTVHVGPTILDYYNVSTEHDLSHCVVFDQNDFNSRGLATTSAIDRMAHFAWGDNGMNGIPTDWYECIPRDSLHVMPYSFNKTELKAKVNSLTAGGNTAIDVGMKWGSILLDPSARSVITSLTTKAHPSSTDAAPRKIVDPLLAGRPVGYTAKENLKVIVLMTDGQNTRQYDLNDYFKTAMSDIWYSPSRGDHVVEVPLNSSNKRWYYPEGYTFQNNRGKWKTKDFYSSKPSDAVQLTYREIYAEQTIDGVQDYFFSNTGHDSMYDAHAQSVVRRTVTDNGSDGIADTNLLNICGKVKEKNVVVYTIAFEAPTNAATLMRTCASSDGHYFDVDGTEITTAFKSIASQINRLRLTQ